MKASLLLPIVALLSNNALAYGEAGQWSSGWGQGTTEYTAVVDAHNSLYIACSDIAKVSMTATVKGQEYGSYAAKGFSLIVNGSEYSAPYETSSRVGENNFYDMWAKLRKAKSITIVTADGQKLALPVKGVSVTLPATNTSAFSCLMWDN